MPGTPGSLADHVCLAAIAEGPTHGWALVKLLRPDGDLGRIWSLSRALTYRAIDCLADAELITRQDRGRRTALSTTADGSSIAEQWRTEPVRHVRDLRTVFLLKLRLLERSGLDPAPLVERQRDELRSALEALTATVPTDAVELWRQESALATQRFLDRIGEHVVSPS
jgi:DNA-binding PadR family transcriptional regulator